MAVTSRLLDKFYVSTLSDSTLQGTSDFDGRQPVGATHGSARIVSTRRSNLKQECRQICPAPAWSTLGHDKSVEHIINSRVVGESSNIYLHVPSSWT